MTGHPIFRTGSAALVLLVLGAAGCGSRTATVSGTVTYRGKPLTMGTVLLVGVVDGTNKTVAAPIQPDGTYLAKEVPPGTVKVGIDNPPPQGAPGGPPLEGSPDDPEVKLLREQAATWVSSPMSYRNPNDSGLSYEIKAGSNPIDIELK